MLLLHLTGEANGEANGEAAVGHTPTPVRHGTSSCFMVTSPKFACYCAQVSDVPVLVHWVGLTVLA